MKRIVDELLWGEVVITAITVAIYHVTRELSVGRESISSFEVLNAVEYINCS